MCAVSSWTVEKAFPWLQSAVFFLFSAVSQWWLCYPVFPVLCSGKCLAFREDAITPPSERILFHLEFSKHSREQMYFLLLSQFFLKRNRKHGIQLHCRQTAQRSSVPLQLGAKPSVPGKDTFVCRKLSN